jgi:uncharacterized protein YehS (DUF1456 family)
MDNNIYIRRLKDRKLLIATLVEQDPHNIYLEYSNITTETYKTITKWCDIDTGLKQFKNTTLKQTQNGLIFDPKSKSFMDLSYDIWDNEIVLNFDEIYPKKLSKHLEIKRTFLKEVAFPQTLLHTLELNGTIGKRISVNSRYIY